MDISMAGVKVMLAMPINRDVPSPTVHALLRTQADMARRNIPVIFNSYDGCSLVHKARCALALDFLGSDCTHLFWIDSDLYWQAEDFARLVALGTLMDCVCGAYCKKDDEPTFYLDYLEKIIEANEYGCVEIKSVAMGFSIVQRKVIEALAEKAPKLKFSAKSPYRPAIFRCDDHNGEMRGEDMAYFADIREAGFKVFLDPTIKLGHIGGKIYAHPITDWIKVVD